MPQTGEGQGAALRSFLHHQKHRQVNATMLKSKSVFVKYTSSIVGIVLAGCIVLSMVFLISAANEVRRIDEKSVTTRLAMASEDLHNNIEMQNLITAEVKTNSVFQPILWKSKVINRKNVIERLYTLTERSSLISNCYLYFRSFDIVFSTTAEYSPDIYGKYIIGQNDFQMITAIDITEPLLLSSIDRPDFLYYIVPIRYRGMGDQWELLICEYNRAKAVEYFSVKYQLPQQMNIQCNKLDLLGSPIVEALYVTDTCNEITTNFGVNYPAGNLWGNAALHEVFWFVSSICIVFSLLSVVIAYRNYLPIQQLLKKLKQEQNPELSEIDQIEHAIEQLIAQNDRTESQLEKSIVEVRSLYTQVKQQIFLNVLNHSYDEKMKRHMVEFGLRVDTPFMRALYIPYCEDASSAEVITRLEECSTDTVYCYALTLPQCNALAAILCSPDSDELTHVAEAIEEILVDRGLKVRIYIGKQVEQLSMIAVSLADAEYQHNNKNVDATDAQPSSGQIFALIQDGKTERALTSLRHALDSVDQATTSRLFRHYHWLELIHQVVSAIRSLGASVTDKQLQELIYISERDTLEKQLSLMIQAVTGAAGIASEQENSGNQMVIDFIKLHAFEYGMCLDYVANSFAISTKQVSRVVKRQTGKNFKEFLLDIRMREALRLIREEKSPAYISTAIGYSTEEYFRKIFRDYMGETITQYILKNRIIIESSDQ